MTSWVYERLILLLTLYLFRATNSYTFPDSSDLEDEEDYDLSDDAEEGGHPSSEDDASIEMPLPIKLSHVISAIDLTVDEQPFVTSSTSIDLTGEDPVEDHANNTANAVSAYNYGKHPIVLESEDEDEDNFGDFPSDSEVQAEIADSTESESSDEELLLVEDYESIDDAEGDVSDAEDADSVMEGSTDDLAEEASQTHFRSAVDGFPAVENGRYSYGYISESAVAASDDAVMDGDGESDYGLSDAGEEGIRALFEDGLLHSESDASEPASVEEPNVDSEQPENDAAQIASPSVSYSHAWEGDAVGLLYKAATLNPPAKFAQILSRPFTGERQPSPSDAAMVKAAPHKLPEQTPTDVPVFHLRSQTFGDLTQKLGDKTGKHAFFEARENNKVKFGGRVNDTSDTFKPTFSTSAGSFSNIPTPKDEPITGREPSSSHAANNQSNFVKFGEPFKFTNSSSAAAKVDEFGMFSKRPDCSSLLTPVTAPASERSVLSFDFLHQPRSLKRARSPEYDMTSAVKFNESKAQSVRSKLSIHDIIENSSRELPLAPKIGEKRKAGEISNVIEDEIREWASMDASKPSDVVSSTPKAAEPEASGSHANDQRPTKKLKTILERAAYAAVGGVAVGASLFFGLVATAPDFA